eukprot:1807225-Rhodomonas_salina.1
MRGRVKECWRVKECERVLESVGSCRAQCVLTLRFDLSLVCQCSPPCDHLPCGCGSVDRKV